MSIFHRVENFVHTTRGTLVYDLTPYQPLLQEIRGLGEQLAVQDDAALLQLSHALQTDAGQGGSLDDLLPTAFALVYEICRRKLQLSAYDVQLLAGIALHQGRLVEMQTGEGKTLAAVFPA